MPKKNSYVNIVTSGFVQESRFPINLGCSTLDIPLLQHYLGMLRIFRRLLTVNSSPRILQRVYRKSTNFILRRKRSMVSIKQINLLRGWPNPNLLPTPAIARAAQSALSDPSVSIPGLLYGPDPGYQPLREEIARWTSSFYRSGAAEDAERICITGGASQNLACVLQVFTDPVKTRVWMVAPCYFMACRIFEDAGLGMSAVREGKEGVDVEELERMIGRWEEENGKLQVSTKRSFISCQSFLFLTISSTFLLLVPWHLPPSCRQMLTANRQSKLQLLGGSSTNTSFIVCLPFRIRLARL